MNELKINNWDYNWRWKGENQLRKFPNYLNIIKLIQFRFIQNCREKNNLMTFLKREKNKKKDQKKDNLKKI